MVHGTCVAKGCQESFLKRKTSLKGGKLRYFILPLDRERWVSHKITAQKSSNSSLLSVVICVCRCTIWLQRTQRRDLARYLIAIRGFRYVCTRRFNQDCAENIFSGIRRNGGGFNDHPEATSALQTLRFLSCAKVLEPLVSESSNCEVTCEAMLVHLGRNLSICILFHET